MSNALIGCYDETLEISYLIANQRIRQNRRATHVESAFNGALPLAVTHHRLSNDWRTGDRRIRQSDPLAVYCASRRISILTYIYLTLDALAKRAALFATKNRPSEWRETRFIRQYPSDEEQCRARWWTNGNYRRRQSPINNWRKVIAINSEIRAVTFQPSLLHLGLSEKYSQGAPWLCPIGSFFKSPHRPATYVCTD